MYSNFHLVFHVYVKDFGSLADYYSSLTLLKVLVHSHIRSALAPLSPPPIPLSQSDMGCLLMFCIIYNYDYFIFS